MMPNNSKLECSMAVSSKEVEVVYIQILATNESIKYNSAIMINKCLNQINQFTVFKIQTSSGDQQLRTRQSRFPQDHNTS